MFDNETITFISDEELRRPVPAGTVALIQVRADRDGALGNFKTGESGFGPWMLVPFEVVEGEHRGEWASMMLNLSGTDRRFRAVFETVTGIDISSGANVSFAEFKTQLIDGVFEAEVGPERRKGVETGYTSVFRLRRKVRTRAEHTGTPGLDAPAPAAPAETGAGTDEDIPF